MGWVLGLGNGVVFRTGSSQSWSSYWTTLTDGVTTIRHAIRDHALCLDITLTSLGFRGVENTDWTNIKQLKRAA